MPLPRKIVEQLVFGPGLSRRYTQDSPVLPDVWIHYGEHPEEPADLLLVPHRRSTAGQVARVLREALDATGNDPRIAAMPSAVAARLRFEDLVVEVLPRTGWWRDRVWQSDSRRAADRARELSGVDFAAALEKGLDRFQRTPGALEDQRLDDDLPADVLWMARLVAWIDWGREVRLTEDETARLLEEIAGHGQEPARGPDAAEMTRRIVGLVGPTLPPPPRRDEMVFLVNRNRVATLAVTQSALAVKADAARLLFAIHCSHLRWAVIDSGIDARHQAFRKHAGEAAGAAAAEDEDEDEDQPWPRRTRVEKTYDFTLLRKLLDPRNLRQLKRWRGEPADPELAEIRRRLLGGLEEAGRERVLGEISDLERAVSHGRDFDWSLVEPLLAVSHDESYPQRPAGAHGTHVAGILAADWRDTGDAEEPVRTGVAPDLRLYDLRVVGPSGVGDEFAVIAALQFVRFLNARQEHLVVHGVNLSLSIEHDVANYACGRTPVCEESERVVASGVVVVAAAGNRGFTRYNTEDGVMQGYHTVSITDPGNAAGVITVGATHRYRPHTYGVSYFSSRGPTGDGRSKPDLVAPGEKISATLPGDDWGIKDGTSMAAPHVSGAAALLMARHNELVGDPLRVKRVLCESATDLGRERYFKGHGMLDVLRALQAL